MISPFLDAGGAGLLGAISLLILFIILATVLEAVVMILLKYNIPFKKAFGDSVLVNATSLLIGFLLVGLKVEIFNYDLWVNYLLLFWLTVIVEVIILYFLNKKKAFSRTLFVCMIMNIVSYVLLFFIALINNN